MDAHKESAPHAEMARRLQKEEYEPTSYITLFEMLHDYLLEFQETSRAARQRARDQQVRTEHLREMR